MRKNIQKLLMIAIIFLGSIQSLYAQSCINANLEMAGVSGTYPTGNGPSIAPQVFTFSNNLNNPVDNVMSTYSPTTTVTFSLSNQQFNSMPTTPSQGMAFGRTFNTASALTAGMGGIGTVAASSYTSSRYATGNGLTAGTVVNATTNVGTFLMINDGNGQPGTNQRPYYGDLTITFNNPVDFPIIHFNDFGGITGTRQFTSEYQMMSGYTMTKLSGSGATTVISGDTIKSAPQSLEEASIRINGTGITSITFKVFLKTNATTAWPTTATSGDAIIIGVSVPSTVPVQPTLTKTTITNSCPSTSVNLNAALPTAILGQSYEWHNVATSATPVSKIVNPATYSGTTPVYLFAKDSLTGCYSLLGDTLNVNLVNCTYTISCSGTTTFREDFGSAVDNLNYGVSGAEHPFDSTFCMNGYITNTTVGLSPGGGSNFTGDVSGDGDNGSHFLYHYTGVGGTLCSNAIGDAAWRNTAIINVVAGQVYEFSYYYRKQNTAGSATIIQQQIIPASGTITKLDSTNNPIVNASWVKNKMVFTPSANGPITLRLNNMLGAVGGNDFGIDNIALSVVPPTPTALNDTIFSSCPSGTYNLATITPAALPGYTYQWHTVATNPNASTLISNTTGASGAGPFYLYATSPGGCYSSPDTVQAVSQTCPPVFNCTGNTYLVQDLPAKLYRYDLLTGTSSVVQSPLAGTSATIGINGIGYNTTDGYLWGYQNNTGKIVRIGADGSTTYFTIPGLPTTAFNVGDVSANGVLFLTIQNGTSLYRVDVNPSSPTYLQLLPNLTTTGFNIADIAFNPIDGNLYSLSATRQLIRYNPATGAATNLGVVTGGTPSISSESTGFGGVFFDSLGNYYVSANTLGQIFKIANTAGGGLVATNVSSAPASGNNDGARCNGTPLCTVPQNPVASSTNVYNICPATSYNLTSLQPAPVSGVTYEWHTTPSNPLATTLVTNPSAITSSGTYYLYAKSSAGSCYSNAGDTVVLNVFNPCIDCDGDGIPNQIDIDDDNDGVADNVENCNSSNFANNFNNTWALMNGTSVATKAGNVNVTTTPVLGTSNNAGSYLSVGNCGGPTPDWGHVDINFSTPVTNAVFYIEAMEFGTEYATLEVMPPFTGTPTLSYTSFGDGATLTQLSPTQWRLNSGANCGISSGCNSRGYIQISGAYYNKVRYTGGSATGNTWCRNLRLNLTDASVQGSCATDLDNDGIPNECDLDSDGDGCADAVEAGNALTTNTTYASTTVYPANPPSITSSTYYATYANTNTLNFCSLPDCDNDGNPNLVDLDDDNDGIFDLTEAASANYVYDNITAGGSITATRSVIDTTTKAWLEKRLLGVGYTGGANYSFYVSPAGATISYQALPPATGAIGTFTAANTVNTLAAWKSGNFLGVGMNTTTTFGFFKNGSTIQVENLTTLGALGTYTAANVDNTLAAKAAGNLLGVMVDPANSFAYGIYKSGSTLAWERLNDGTTGTYSAAFSANAITAFNNGNLLGVDVAGSTTVYAMIYSGTDIDNDGIPNTCDLDSDGDGCADAIESGNALTTNTTYTSTTVYPATPPSITSSTNYSTYVINNAQNYCTLSDCDNDGVPNLFDLDDDNDGVVDLTENCLLPQPQNIGTTNAIIGGTANATKSGTTTIGYTAISGTSNVLLSNTVLAVGNHLAASPDAGSAKLTFPTPITNVGFYIDAMEFGTEYVEFEVLPPFTGTPTISYYNSLGNGTLTQINATKWRITSGVNCANSANCASGGTIQITGGFYSAVQVTGGSGTANTWNKNIWVRLGDAVVQGSCSTDTDGDGTPNECDLDSDGDGCADAVEAGNASMSSTTYASTTTYPAAPPSTTTSTNYSVWALNAGNNYCSLPNCDNDSIPNAFDTDDDNDGVSDIIECPSLAYKVYTYNRVGPGWSTNAPFTITGQTTTNITIDQNTAGTDLTYNSVNWKLLSTNVVPDLDNKITVSLLPTAATNGSYLAADAMLITNGVNTYVIDNSSASGFTTSGTWVSQNVATSYLGNNVFSNTPHTGKTATWAFTGIPNATCDLDNDGIPNYCDLDSDGDGCADAVEAGNVPTTPSSAWSSTTIYSVTPPSNTASTKYSIYALDNTRNYCTIPDCDNDGVPNIDDSDDDNDGIPDLQECGTPAPSLLLSEFNGTFGTLLPGTVGVPSGTITRNLQTPPAANYTYAAPNNTGAGQYAVISKDNYLWFALDGRYFFGGHTTGLANDAYLAVNGSTLTGVFYKDSLTVSASDNYDIGLWATGAMASGNNNCEIGIRLKNSSGTVIASTSTGILPTNGTWQAASVSNLLLSPGTYVLEVYNISLALAGNDFAIDDIYFKTTNPASTCSSDTDNDGTPNSCDLDSDGDGCSDAYESGATTNTTANYYFPLPVNTNGVSTSIGTFTSTYSNAIDSSIHTCPTATPDTVFKTPACTTCPINACVIADDLSAGGQTYTSCGTPNGYTAIGPDANGCITYTPNGPNTTADTTCIIACKNGTCDTTYIIINPPVTPDTNKVTPACPTCPINSCVVADDLTPGGQTYTSCGTPNGYTAVGPDANGCITYTPTGPNTTPDTTCIIACKNGVCDTTIIIINPPVTPDTNKVTPACPTCPINSCVVADDLTPGGQTYTSCGTPNGYTAVGPDANGCITYTPTGPNTTPDTTCIIACKGGVCDTTIIIINPPVSPDTNKVTPACPTCPINTCVVADDLTPGGQTYTSCGTPNGYTAIGPDANGCITYTPTGPNTTPDTTCIIACKNGICDTTIIIINPPVTPDTNKVTPACPTCPINSCVVADDLTPGGQTYTSCGTPNGYTAVGPDANGCITYTPTGPNTTPDTTCIIACKNGICDTTFIIINPPVSPDTVIKKPACPTCPVNACVVADDLTPGGQTFTSCGTPNGYTAVGPDVNGCITYTPNGPNTTADTTCIIACKNGICDTTYVIINPPISPDTVVKTPACPTCPVTVCQVINDVTITAGATFSSCPTPAGYTASPTDVNGCKTYTPNGINTTPDTTCQVICKNGICDTTYVIINPPITPDTNTVTPSCPTCPINTCVVADDLTPGGQTYSACPAPAGYTQVGPDVNGCITLTPIPGASNGTTCIVACKNGKCDTTYIIINPPITPDTNKITPACPTCPINTCVVADDLTPGGQTYTTCGAPNGYTAVGPDANGCVTYTPNGPNAIADTTCIVACKNGKCDTTYIIINPPITPDSVSATPACPTCPVTICQVLDDIPSAVGSTFSSCPAPAGYTLGTINANGCRTYTPNGTVNTTVTTCQVICKNGVCDTTYITINPPITPDTVTVTPACPTCPINVCQVLDDVTSAVGATFSSCPTPAGYTAGPLDASGCRTFTPNGTVTAPVTTCQVICNNGKCDTTYIIINPPITPDTNKITPACPTCPVNTCVQADDLTPGGQTYTSCGTPNGYTAVGPNANGCITYTPNGINTTADTTCIVACKNGKCDTTYIIINPPVTPDSVTVQPTCPTCPVKACVMADDLPNVTGASFTSCGLQPADASKGQLVLDLQGCLIWVGNGLQGPTDTIKSCVVACKNGVCDTTYVNILPAVPPYGPDSIYTTPTCTTCPTPSKCVTGDDIPVGANNITYTSCGLSTTDATMGSLNFNSTTGCVVWTPNATQSDTVKTCVIVCGQVTVSTVTSTVCDTTYFFFPPSPKPDTITKTPACPTCAVVACPTADNIIITSTTAFSTCATPAGYTVSGPDVAGCMTYTPTGNNTTPVTTCVVACNGIICDTTYVIINPPITPDTNTVRPACPTCPVNTCVQADDLTPGGQTFTSCGAPSDYTQSAPDASGCITLTPQNVITGGTTCIVACKNGKCDTTYIVILPPITPDTLTVTPTCATCPIQACVVGDDIAGGLSGATYSTCPPPPGFTTSGPDANGCVAYTGPSTPNTVPVTTCIVACKNGVCDTTYVIINPPGENKLNPDFNTTYVNVPVSGNINTNDIIVAPGSTYGTPTAVPGNPSGCTPTIAANGTYTFVCNTPGEYNYLVPVCPPGITLNCPTELLTITVLDPNNPQNPPTADPDFGTTKKDTPITIDVKANDKCNNGPTCTLSPPTVIDSANNGTLVVNPDGTIKYTPDPGFVGKDTLMYAVCDNQSPVSKCDTEYVFIDVLPTNVPNSTTALDDYNKGGMGEALNGNVKTNDTDPEADNQTVTPQNITIPGKGTFVLNTDGSYVFTPVDTFKGPIDIPYTICDDGSPLACSNATLHILIAQPDVTPNITATPNIMHGTTTFNVTVKVTELNMVKTNGLITVRIPKDNRLIFSYNPTAVKIGFTNVSNSVWTYDATNAFFHVFTTTAVIPKGGFSTFGFVASFAPGNTDGKYTMTSTIKSGSGSENRTNNNNDAESLDYFHN